MYSDLAQEHITNPRNPGPLESATHKGVSGEPGEGPYMILWFEVREGVIRRAGFQSFGCAAATAVGSITTVLLTGRTIEQALQLTAADIDLVLGGLPEGQSGRVAATQRYGTTRLQVPWSSRGMAQSDNCRV
jgi:nitrogen fixation NifU-like protein